MNQLLALCLVFSGIIRRCFSSKVFDSHGCCLSCGSFYCKITDTCSDDWAKCEHGHQDEESCSFVYSIAKKPFKYDLSSLANERPLYQIFDKSILSTGTSQLSILFNFCKALPRDELPDLCHDTVGVAGEICKGKSLAYLYSESTKKGNSCKSLTGCIDIDKQIEISLLDPFNPAGGISIKYQGGNTCSKASDVDEAEAVETCSAMLGAKDAAEAYCTRSLTLNVKCRNEVNDITNVTEIQKVGQCGYIVGIEHMAGCPVECPRSSVDGTVCSNHGVCFYDDAEKEPVKDIFFDGLQCLCSNGYYGDACGIYEGSHEYHHLHDHSMTQKDLPELGWLDFFSATFALFLIIICFLLLAIFWECLIECCPAFATCFGICSTPITSYNCFGLFGGARGIQYQRIPTYDQKKIYDANNEYKTRTSMLSRDELVAL